MIYFTDNFNISEETLDAYGAFNISLINDLPLFIDPFLLYGSKKKEYLDLHHSMLNYLTFLKSKSERGKITDAEIKSWYKFPEVKQNWLGFSINGNRGSGLGLTFGKAMSGNMKKVYSDLNEEKITLSSHIEKVGLFQLGVGKDNISDFSCNLIKSYLLEYTEKFAKENIAKEKLKLCLVDKVYFDYKLERWMPKQFTLPYLNDDYVILTPKDLLTKDENWINSNDLKGDFSGICGSIPNDQFRSEINKFYHSQLPAPVLVGKGKKSRYKGPSTREINIAINKTIQEFPQILNYYIKRKEENKEGAKNVSQQKVNEVEAIFRINVKELTDKLNDTGFYEIQPKSSYEEAMKRVNFMKDVIENKDGYKFFTIKDILLKEKPIYR